MNIPAELSYTKDHEWLKKITDGWLVGITDFAQSELGDVVFADLPAPGKTIKRGETLAVVESVKAASDVYAPVSGRVKSRNEQVTTAPELLNSDPYGSGWMVVLEDVADAELGELMTAAQYQALLAGK